MPTVTTELILGGMSRRGGWSRRQLELLGVPWPLTTGWRARAIGAEISADAAAEFLALRDAHAKAGRPEAGEPAP